MFNPDGQVRVPAELLYKKNILVTRGSFKPFTKINLDMMEQGMREFSQLPGVNADNTLMLAEITMNQLVGDNENMVDHDFVERVDLLSAMGYHVMISDYVRYFRLRAYLRQFTQKQIGLVMGMDNLRRLFQEDFYRGVEGGIFEGLGKLFPDNTIAYAYPELDKDGQEVNYQTVSIPSHLRHLYQHLIDNGFVRGITTSDSALFAIHSHQVLEEIRANQSGWEESVPASIAELIKAQRLFGYNSR